MDMNLVINAIKAEMKPSMGCTEPVALALAAVIYTVVTGAAELRYQARAREALAQVKAARLAAGALSAPIFSKMRTAYRFPMQGLTALSWRAYWGCC